MTLTTEQLRNLMEFNLPDHDSTSANADAWEVNEMAAELLANREAQPVIVVGDDGGDALAYRRLIQSFAPGTKLYAAPPAPAVPEEMKRDPDADVFDPGFMNGWNACRAAMLAQPVSSGYALPEGWIACSERMPVDTQTVLCSNLLTELSGIPFIADYVGEFQLYDGTKYESGFYINRELQTVTHWMPLPAAPEGGN
ncbi:TPA: DUF551 domain-containing protein [Serratia marcescens]|nr:DUF551 domain-containing protein [Serratia marcescens]